MVRSIGLSGPLSKNRWEDKPGQLEFAGATMLSINNLHDFGLAGDRVVYIGIPL